MDRNELFNTSMGLFGTDNIITAGLQNPGVINSQDLVEEILKTAGLFVERRRIMLKEYENKVTEFKINFIGAFSSGELRR